MTVSKEGQALAGAMAAAAVPVGLNATNFQQALVDVADTVFAGEQRAAATWVSGGFALAGLILIVSAFYGDGIGGIDGALAVGFGVSLLAAAIETWLVV